MLRMLLLQHSQKPCNHLQSATDPFSLLIVHCLAGENFKRIGHRQLTELGSVVSALNSQDSGAFLHVIPLALGGPPRKIDNLQLQPWEEVKLQCLVCSGEVRLELAQSEILADREAAYDRYARVKC
jgi:hypothetical protein